jgi:DeoR/GlpR family transcriptional regulator of sugar metabolism
MYILYRADRSRVREMNTRLMKVYSDLTFKDAKDIDLKRENANIDGNTAMGTMLKYGSEGAKQFYDLFVLNPDHSNAHKTGVFHIHDLDFLTLTTTCCQIDIVKLFKDGFSTGHGFLREPQDIASYAALACIAIQSNQNDQHGGQSIPNFDYGMASGVKKTYIKSYRQHIKRSVELLVEGIDLDENIDNIFSILEDEYNLYPTLENQNGYIEKEGEYLLEILNDELLAEKAQSFAKKNAYIDTDKKTYQAMEALIHNLNTMHSRAGAQVPFSSLNYGTDTSEEGRMVIRNLLLSTERGLGNGETPIFPIHIFKVKEGVNYNSGDKNYDLFSEKDKQANEKYNIGKKAISLLEPNDVIIIDTGTTTEYIARLIPDDLPLTIICYTTNVLVEIYKKPLINIIFAGGFYHRNSQMFESPESIELIKRTCANKVFTSASGISKELGITCVNHYEIETKCTAIKSAFEKILLVDSTKFDKIGPAYFANISDFDVVITDSGIEKKWINYINGLDIQLHIV